MQDVAAERAFYDELFEKNPENEHITYGYDELYDLAFVEKPDGPVLDVGCGTGAHAVRLARRGFDVVAVDLTRAGVRAARERFRREGLSGSFVVANAEQLPFKDRFAAVTWTSLLIHHFPQPNKVSSEVSRVTRDRLVAFEPNAANFLTWLAMNVLNRWWGLDPMTRNQSALLASRVRRMFESQGFTQASLHFVHRAWGDSMGLVRRTYAALTAWLPERFRANKFLIAFDRRSL